ncbi:MAG: F-box protein [Parachlamydiales bacterium]|jgi:hypothetical protein
MSCTRYITNIITSNDSPIDKWGNYLMQPITRLWELKTGTKQVREFFVEKKTQALFESFSESTELTTQRIFFDVLLAIPFTIAGAICKFLATTFNPQVAKNYQELFASTLLLEPENIDFLVSTNKIEIRQADSRYQSTSIKISLFPNIVLKILSNLSITDIKNVRLVSKGFRTLTDSNIGREDTELYRKTHLKGLSLDPKITPSYRSIIFSYQNHIREFNYQRLKEIFGDINNIFYLKVYQTTPSEHGVIQDVDALAHREDFEAYPPVFRLRFKRDNNLTKEVFVIKYSLFVPKEYDESAHDKVWHDCLVLSPPDRTINKWKVNDLRHPDHLPKIDSQSSRSAYNYQEFPRSPTEPHQSQLYRQTFTSYTLDEESITKVRLRNLIENKTVGFYDQRKIRKNNTFVPSFIYESSQRSSKNKGRLFLSLPVKLGHVPVTDFKFTIQRLPAPSQLYVDPQGAITRLSPNDSLYEADRGGALEMLTFESAETSTVKG